MIMKKKKMNSNFGNYYKKISNRRSFICGIKSTTLSKKEVSFLKLHKPWGIILFSRNIRSIYQTKNLTDNIKKIFKDKNYPILIDEEGGRVSRLNNILDNSLFTSKFFGNLYKKNNKKFNLLQKTYIEQISYILRQIGVNINTVPVLDLYRKKSNKIIGNRSYSNNRIVVLNVGKLVIKKYLENKIGTVMKHIPGHGLAKSDSHKKLPIVKKNLQYLKNNDFYPFKQNISLAMTAHILYEKIDKKYCATHSSKIIKLIRNHIKFKGILISDDISMKALKYSISNNTIKAFNAGCDLVLHCNGKLSEMNKVAKNSPKISKFIIKKTSQLLNKLS